VTVLSTKDLIHWRLNLKPGTLVQGRGVLHMVSTEPRTQTKYFAIPTDMTVMVVGKLRSATDGRGGLRITVLVEESTYWLELADLWPLDHP